MPAAAAAVDAHAGATHGEAGDEAAAAVTAMEGTTAAALVDADEDAIWCVPHPASWLCPV